MLEMDDIRKYMLSPEVQDSLLVRDLMHSAQDYVYEDEKMESVMRKFDVTGAWRLPVLDADGRYKGFISRSRILTAYREELKQLTED